MLSNPYLLAFITTFGVGLICELTARLGKFWLYQKPIYPLLNILLIFGIVMGALSLLVPRSGFLPIFIVATAIGYAYEKINFSYLHWWAFPQNKFLGFNGQEACARSVALLWGVTPLTSHSIQATLL